MTRSCEKNRAQIREINCLRQFFEFYGVSRNSVAARFFSLGAHAPSRAVVGALADRIPAKPNGHTIS
jgi:hypothetical protein